tara:strand:- start:55 stop:297 length:243 start_codon:yes stop_codon:yes gene_type:complete
MSKKLNFYLQGMIGRNADIDLVVAEFVGQKADLKSTLKSMKSEQQALQRQLDQEHRKVINMQTVIDLHMLEYEQKPAEER